MGTTTTSNENAGRRLVVAALAALAAVTGLSFGRVFQGGAAPLRLALAAVVAVLVAAAMERRHLVLSLAASAVGLIATLGILVFPGTTWAGFPSDDTVSSILSALARAGDRAAHEVAPAPPLPSIMTAAMVAMWSAAAASHSLAVRARATVLPLLPGASLMGFVGVVMRGPPSPLHVVAFLAAAFLLLFAQAVVRNGGWSVGRRRAVVSTRSARLLGVVAVLAAVAVPGLLPGYRDAAILQLRGGEGRVSVSPIVDIRPNLLRNPAAELFRVRAGRPAYWRMVTLDTFDGNVWSSSALDEIRGPLVEGQRDLALPALRKGSRLEQRFFIEELDTSWLPAAPEPIEVNVPSEVGARLDADSGALVLDTAGGEGLVYDVVSSTPDPAPSDLLAVSSTEADPRYLTLPPMPHRLHEIAAQVTRRAGTGFERVLAIQEHLRGFTYDEHAPAGHGTNAMVNFLDETRQGYCEQFAGTMAVMVRLLGLPARVAIGFLPGERDAAGMYRVTTAQVHAWPEVFFPGHGWLAFEPTPSRSNPTADYLIAPPSAGRRGSAAARDGGEVPDAAAGARENFRRDPATPQPQGTVAPPPGAERGGSLSTWRTVALATAAAALAAALALALRKATRRRSGLRDTNDPRARVVAAYGWMSGIAADVGHRRRAGETLREYRRRLTHDAGLDAAPLDRLSSLAGMALYSDAELGPDDGNVAVAAAREVGRELRRRAGAARAIAGAVRPG